MGWGYITAAPLSSLLIVNENQIESAGLFVQENFLSLSLPCGKMKPISLSLVYSPPPYMALPRQQLYNNSNLIRKKERKKNLRVYNVYVYYNASRRRRKIELDTKTLILFYFFSNPTCFTSFVCSFFFFCSFEMFGIISKRSRDMERRFLMRE